LDHFCSLPLAALQQVHISPVLRTLNLDIELQVQSVQCRIEGQNHLPRPAGHSSSGAAQHTVFILGHESTLVAYVQHAIHLYLQVLYGRAVLNPFVPELILIAGVVVTQVQYLPLGFVQAHEILPGPQLEPV